MKIEILGVKVDQVNMGQSLELVENWIMDTRYKILDVREKTPRSKYIVTPNPEMIIAAQKDEEFRKALNNADLAIPDSPRLGWAKRVLEEKNPFVKILLMPLFLFPQMIHFDVVAGIDLMDQILAKAQDRAFTVGFLGGQKKVAERVKERLVGKYPKLKVVYAESGGKVDWEGNILNEDSGSKMLDVRQENQKSNIQDPTSNILNLPSVDLLFVAFGHIKQEKWMVKNLEKYPVKVMMGVGGSFDYLAGVVPRAPELMRNLGFEWLFRLVLQPWRIKRFWSLVEFVFMVFLKP